MLEPLVLGTRTWSVYFVISKFLDYTQNYMMLLEQCGHIVLKGLATGTGLDDDQIHVCLVRDCTSLLHLLKNFSKFLFQLCRLLKTYVWHCTRFWAGRFKCHWGVGNFHWWECTGLLILPSKKVETHKAGNLVYKKLALNCVEQWTFELQWASSHSFQWYKRCLLCKKNR